MLTAVSLPIQTELVQSASDLRLACLQPGAAEVGIPEGEEASWWGIVALAEASVCIAGAATEGGVQSGSSGLHSGGSGLHSGGSGLHSSSTGGSGVGSVGSGTAFGAAAALVECLSTRLVSTCSAVAAEVSAEGGYTPSSQRRLAHLATIEAPLLCALRCRWEELLSSPSQHVRALYIKRDI